MAGAACHTHFCCFLIASTLALHSLMDGSTFSMTAQVPRTWQSSHHTRVAWSRDSTVSGDLPMLTILATLRCERSATSLYLMATRNGVCAPIGPAHLAGDIVGDVTADDVLDTLWTREGGNQRRLCRWLCAVDRNALENCKAGPTAVRSPSV